MEQERLEEAASGGPPGSARFLTLAIVGFVVLLLGAVGGGYAALALTGGLAPRPAAPPTTSPGDAKPPDHAKPPSDTKPADHPKAAVDPKSAALLGRWEMQEPDKDTVLFAEFASDGSLVTGNLIGGNPVQQVSGTWTLPDENTLEVTLNIPGKDKPPPLKRRLKFQATQNQLMLTDEQDHSDIFRRAGAK